MQLRVYDTAGDARAGAFYEAELIPVLQCVANMRQCFTAVHALNGALLCSKCPGEKVFDERKLTFYSF